MKFRSKNSRVRDIVPETTSLMELDSYDTPEVYSGRVYTSEKRQKMKVFIAENSQAVCKQIISLLAHRKEIEVVGSTHDVWNAKESIWKLKPDLVILSIKISDGSGFEIMRFLHNRDIPAKLIIIVTSNPYPQLRERCKQLGADFIFDKSEALKKLPGALNELLEDFFLTKNTDNCRGTKL